MVVVVTVGGAAVFVGGGAGAVTVAVGLRGGAVSGAGSAFVSVEIPFLPVFIAISAGAGGLGFEAEFGGFRLRRVAVCFWGMV